MNVQAETKECSENSGYKSEFNELEGFVDWKGRATQKRLHGGMRSTLFIYVTEVFETLSFISTPVNLVTYLTGFMHMEIAEAANTLTNFVGTLFLLTLVGGYISDAHFNRFQMTVFSACVELAGYIILLIQAHYESLKPPLCNQFDPTTVCVKESGAKAVMLYIGLYVVAIGNGGIKAALLPLGADQLYTTDPIDRRKISTYFNMFFMSLNIGSSIAITVVVWVQNNKGWEAGFGISTAAISLAIMSIVAGLRTYRNSIPGSSPLTRILQVFVAAFHNRKLTTPERPDDLYELQDKEAEIHTEKLRHTKQFNFLDKAATLREGYIEDENNVELSPWQLCSVNRVEEIKFLAPMMPIFACTIMIYTCLAQLQTFSVSQGLTMDRSMGKQFEIPAGSLPIIPIVFILILTPFYDRIFVPLARKFTGHESRITHLQRIGIGLFLSGMSMGIDALVEVKRKKVAKDNGMVDAIPLLMSPLPVSVFWLSFQFLIFGIAEMFTFSGLMEFFHSEAPAGMTSMATAFSWVSLSMRYFLSSASVHIVNAATRNITNSNGWLGGTNLNRNHLSLFYWLLAFLNMLKFLNYLFWSSWYKYKHDTVLGSQATYEKASRAHFTST